MTGHSARLRTCTELTLRLGGVVVASLMMSALLIWVWTDQVTPTKVWLAWLGWCVAITLYAAAAHRRRPRIICYALALVPAASPYLFVLGFYSTWWLLSTLS